MSKLKVVLLYAVSPILPGFLLGLYFLSPAEFFEGRLDAVSFFFFPFFIALAAILFFGLQALLCGIFAILIFKRVPKIVWLLLVSLFGGMISSVIFFADDDRDIAQVLFFFAVGFCTAFVVSSFVLHRDKKMQKIGDK